MPYDFSLSARFDRSVARRFAQSTGLPATWVTDLLEIAGESFPHLTQGQLMEFLWCHLPLRYADRIGPPAGALEQTARFLEFVEGEFGVDLGPARSVVADVATFNSRWQRLAEESLPAWLEELRREVTARGFSSTIPPVDPADPHFSALGMQFFPGKLPLAVWHPAPVPAPEAAELEAMRTAPALENIKALMQIVGDGLKLTKTGHLKLADGRSAAEAMGCADLFDERIGDRVFKTKSTAEIAPLQLMLKWGRSAGLLKVRNASLQPTARGRRLGKDPDSDWWLMFRTLVLKVRWLPLEPSPYGFWFWSKDVDEFLPAFLRIAAETAGRGLALRIPARIAWSMVEQRWVVLDPDRVVPEEQQESISSHVYQQLFVPLEMLGAAEVWVGAALHSVRLTPLGRWAAAQLAHEVRGELGGRGPGAQPKRSPKSVLRLKITLLEIEPPIWRRVEVDAGTKLDALHQVIQAAFGWLGYHLHEFEIGGSAYGTIHPENWEQPEDETKVVLSKVAGPGTKFLYRYDFGDGWKHEVEVEEQVPADPSVSYPVCVDGERARPPEDVGGPWGYSDFLEAIADPTHSEHESTLTWAGGSFDPEHFDCDAFADNLMIQQLDF